MATTVTLLTDAGWAGELPGVLESIILDTAPDARVVHLTHDVEPHDVRGGSLLLARAIAYLASGVVVAAVDPFADRSYVAIEIAGGSGILLGPDNGLLAPAVAMAGGASRARALDNVDLHLESPGGVLAVRDVLAAVAAHLCSGVAFEALGSALDPVALLPGVIPIPRHDGDAIAAEVLWVDRYGNVQLNVAPSDVEPLGQTLSLTLGAQTRTAQRLATAQGLGEGRLALVDDPYGLLALSLCRRSAALDLGLQPGDGVLIAAAGSGSRVATPVVLRR